MVLSKREVPEFDMLVQLTSPDNRVHGQVNSSGQRVSIQEISRRCKQSLRVQVPPPPSSFQPRRAFLKRRLQRAGRRRSRSTTNSSCVSQRQSLPVLDVLHEEEEDSIEGVHSTDSSISLDRSNNSDSISLSSMYFEVPFAVELFDLEKEC